MTVQTQNAKPRPTEGSRVGGKSRGKGGPGNRGPGRPKGSPNRAKSLVPTDLAESLLVAMRGQLPAEHFEYVKGVVKQGKAVSTKRELQTLILLLSRNLWAALIDEMRPPQPETFEDAVDLLETTGKLHRGGQAMKNARARIVERDGPVCGRCGEPIDLSLSGLEPEGLTVGHIIPVARGGSDDDSNLRPEHRRCNLPVQERRDSTTPVFRRDVTERLKVLSSLLGLLHQIEKRDEEKADGPEPLVTIFGSRGLDRSRLQVLVGLREDTIEGTARVLSDGERTEGDVDPESGAPAGAAD